MAILNDLKGKVAQVSQSAIQKTQDLTEIARLESRISDAKEKINNLYGEIGYKVYLSYAERPLPEAADLIAQVSQLHAEIDRCQAQINAINSATTCPSCGAKVDRNATFCSECGAKIVRAEPSGAPQERCVNCGSPLAPGAIFCSECGTKQPPQEETAGVQPGAKVCASCGAALPADSVFCTVCGSKIE